MDMEKEDGTDLEDAFEMHDEHDDADLDYNDLGSVDKSDFLCFIYSTFPKQYLPKCNQKTENILLWEKYRGLF